MISNSYIFSTLISVFFSHGVRMPLSIIRKWILIKLNLGGPVPLTLQMELKLEETKQNWRRKERTKWKWGKKAEANNSLKLMSMTHFLYLEIYFQFFWPCCHILSQSFPFLCSFLDMQWVHTKCQASCVSGSGVPTSLLLRRSISNERTR